MHPLKERFRMKRSYLVAILPLFVVLAACDSSPSTPFDTEAPSPLSMTKHDAHGPHAVSARTSHAADLKELADIRRSTAMYQQVERALADGFIPLGECVASPWGGMGRHYGNPSRVEDPSIDPTMPEILLYEPMENGRERLVGVEYLVPAAAWYAQGHNSPPSVAGQSFDPPNPNHPDELVAVSYTLHVWVWRDNPDGMFTPFNPKVGCS
jgi:hypothetical protein